MLLLDRLGAVVPDDTAIQGYKTPEAIGFTEVNLCFAGCALSYQQKRIDAAKSRGSDSCFNRLISSLEGLSGREIKVERSTTNTLRPLVN
ncbi:hypothetical protein ASPTUDRAFT_61553 [Aspergillus tubingensis CBS 134.48]|uniref:Uncharacterized protein n=1 Tax=Aspergillus tubingensis (strain CBS 134.48) TaxID=767770 RepID=A0A1L9NGB6_ASPTC|nr:hypothetical protein ASPTUDRAFT_61553 [Aspergillus tubingensis CBS 134.48]